MKSILIVTLMSLAFSANAAGNDNSNDCPGNSCHGGEGGAGGNAISVSEGGSATGGTGIGIGGTGGTGIGTGVGVGYGGNQQQGQIQGQQQGQTSNSGGNSIAVQGDKVEAPHIPTASSIAASGNGTAECLIHSQVSFNAFFVSFAKGGHEVEYICMAQKLGLQGVAVQMSCNKNADFRKAYNQIAATNGTAACLE